MSGEYGGWNGNRDFSGEGKGCGIAWDLTQTPLHPADRIGVAGFITSRLGGSGPIDQKIALAVMGKEGESVLLPHFHGHNPARQSLNPGVKVS